MIIDTAAASLDGPTARCEYFGAKKKSQDLQRTLTLTFNLITPLTSALASATRID